jgi:hypothetical protein
MRTYRITTLKFCGVILCAVVGIRAFITAAAERHGNLTVLSQ